MSMEMPKDMAVLDPRVVESRAEALLAMDVLTRRLADKYDQTGWLSNGMTDGAPPLRMTQERLDTTNSSSTASRTSSRRSR